MYTRAPQIGGPSIAGLGCPGNCKGMGDFSSLTTQDWMLIGLIGAGLLLFESGSIKKRKGPGGLSTGTLIGGAALIGAAYLLWTNYIPSVSGTS